VQKKTWKEVKLYYCERVAQQVSLEAEMVHPAEYMPDQPARILTHRCSNGRMCNSLEKVSCRWAGTNPVYDPFLEKIS
jgi:hypothetical protein